MSLIPVIKCIWKQKNVTVFMKNRAVYLIAHLMKKIFGSEITSYY